MNAALSVEQKLTLMLALQDRINTLINPNWRDAQYPWYRAIWTECAELLDHIGWKWWKQQMCLIEQVQLEIIDIWHFGMSNCLNLHPPEVAASILSKAVKYESREVTKVDAEQLRIAVEDFAAAALSKKSFPEVQFFYLMTLTGLSFNELYVKYIGKNVLNRFRQDFGYKSGQYVKIWDGREDNKWLEQIAVELNTDDPAFEVELYEALRDKYTKLVDNLKNKQKGQ